MNHDMDELMEIAAEAWEKWPAPENVSTRHKYVLAQLEDEKTYSLIKACRPEILVEAAEWLLARAAKVPPRQRRKGRSRKTGAVADQA